MVSIPQRLRPAGDEGAVLSAIAAETEGRWHLLSASLLTVPADTAAASWPRWRRTRSVPAFDRQDGMALDPGPRFTIAPLNRIRAIRAPIRTNEWDSVVDSLASGHIDLQLTRYIAEVGRTGPTVYIATEGSHPAHRVVEGLERPVEAVVAPLREIDGLPRDQSTSWEIPEPRRRHDSHLSRALLPSRRRDFWSRDLLGITWFPSVSAPPPCLVIGRLQDTAWITDMRPGDDSTLRVSLGWNPDAVDLLGCSVTVEHAVDGLPLPRLEMALSDLPVEELPAVELRARPSTERVLTTRLAKGARRTDFGISLRGPDGNMLDERPVALRVETVSLTVSVMGDPTDRGTTSTVGDTDPAPTMAALESAIREAEAANAEVRRSTAQRRMSSAAAFRNHLRWRLSCRNGELLILDPWIAADRARLGGIDAVLSFLASLNRPVRALGQPPGVQGKKPARPLPPLPTNVAVRWLPAGVGLHDRFWCFGETALHVGSSLNAFAGPAGRNNTGLSTVAEMTSGGAADVRARFEAWWSTSAGEWPRAPSAG